MMVGVIVAQFAINIPVRVKLGNRILVLLREVTKPILVVVIPGAIQEVIIRVLAIKVAASLRNR